MCAYKRYALINAPVRYNNFVDMSDPETAWILLTALVTKEDDREHGPIVSQSHCAVH